MRPYPRYRLPRWLVVTLALMIGFIAGASLIIYTGFHERYVVLGQVALELVQDNREFWCEHAIKAKTETTLKPNSASALMGNVVIFCQSDIGKADTK